MKSVTNARSGLSGQLLKEKSTHEDKSKSVSRGPSNSQTPEAVSHRKQSNKSKPSFTGTIQEGEEPLQTQPELE
jgi:hypothetical protein